MVSVDLACLRARIGADDHRSFGPVAVQRAEAGVAALYGRGTVGATARRGVRAPRRGRGPGVRDRGADRLFELGLSEVALAFTAASSKTDQTAIATIVTAEGFAAAWLRGKGLDWAADMLTAISQEISR